mgnify:CR=1 FL=1|tara:strand:+ start:8952 stop:9302 length:351 start_codon:yes stop_codon:yes gene_type:complete
MFINRLNEIMNKTQAQQFKKSCKYIQDLIFQNKEAKGFNISNVPLEFCLTQGELAEAFDAWRKSKPDLSEELADTAIYLFGLASILKIDLGKEIVKKIEKNKNRKYFKNKGVLLKK